MFQRFIAIIKPFPKQFNYLYDYLLTNFTTRTGIGNIAKHYLDQLNKNTGSRFY